MEGLIMKKMVLLLTLTLLATPAFAFDYANLGPKTVYSNTSMRYYSPRNLSTNKANSANAEFWSAFFAGSTMATGRLNLLATPSLRGGTLTGAAAFLDPYIVNINGNSYVLVKDSKDNNWTAENILGYTDNRDDLFASLKSLETDGDKSKITSAELKTANIRFVLLNSDQTLALNERNLDFDINKVQYIDMKNLRTALGNKNEDGTFGYFYVIINENGKNKAYPGRVTFEEKEELDKYIK